MTYLPKVMRASLLGKGDMGPAGEQGQGVDRGALFWNGLTGHVTRKA